MTLLQAPFDSAAHSIAQTLRAAKDNMAQVISFSLPELLFCFSAIPKCSAVLPAPGVFCFFILLAAVQRCVCQLETA